MRVTLLLLTTAILAWGIVQLVGDDEEPEPALPGVESSSLPVEAETGRRLPMPQTGVLVVTVKSRSAHVPRGAEGGYRYCGVERFRPVNERGQAIFLDAPLGALEVLGRAPGFRSGRQKRFLNAGIRLDVILALQREDGPAPKGGN